MNPVTDRPYRSKDEYDEVGRMSPDQITEAIRRRRQAPQATPQPGGPQPQPGPQTQIKKRHPDQLDECSNELYDTLRQAVVDCKAMSFSCSDAAERETLGITTRKKFDKLPPSAKWQCLEILRRMGDAKKCDEARETFQKKCFGDKTDSGHDEAMESFAKAFESCRRKAIDRNCL
jgi:hypothetical protein